MRDENARLRDALAAQKDAGDYGAQVVAANNAADAARLSGNERRVDFINGFLAVYGHPSHYNAAQKDAPVTAPREGYVTITIPRHVAEDTSRWDMLVGSWDHVLRDACKRALANVNPESEMEKP